VSVPHGNLQVAEGRAAGERQVDEVVREAELDAAGGSEPLVLPLLEPNLERPEVILQGECLERDMVALKLSEPLCMAAVAAPAYFERHGVPETPRDLHRHRCINWRRPTDGSLYRWEFERKGRQLEVAVTGPLIVNDAVLALRAALDGVGIAYIFDEEAAPWLARGALRRVLEAWSPSFPGFYLYYPSRRHTPAPLAAFIEFLRSERPARAKKSGVPARKAPAQKRRGS